MKSIKKWIIPIVIILLVGMYVANVNNNAVEKQEEAQTAWSDVESSYQRRSDLIPNLVKTVEGAADFERGTLTDVIEARSKATQVKIDPSNLDEADMQRFQEAQNEVSSTLSRLLVTVERYPELKATENFQTLQSQLEGTENRINISRNRYNAAVKEYNVYVRKFPQKMIAGFIGFNQMPRFEADEGAERAPEVEFDF